MSPRGVVTIALLLVKRVARDRVALFFIVLLPAAIIFVIGNAIGGFGERVDLGVVGGNNGPLAHRIETSLRAQRVLRIHDYATQGAMRAALRHGEVLAGAVIPRDYDALVRDASTQVAFWGDPTHSATGAVRAAVTSAVDEQAALIGAARANPAAGFDRALVAADQQNAGGAAVTVHATRTTSRRGFIPAGFAWTAPTNLVLFVFITSMASSGRLVELRTSGLAARVAATPVGPNTLLVGEMAGSMLVALAQGVLIILLGSFVFGVHWGSLSGALTVLAMVALVATALGVLLGTVLRTAEQSAIVGPPVGIALGMLGGCLWPLGIVGKTMQTIGHLTPHAWAMDAYIHLIGEGQGLRDIVPQLLVLAAFAAVLIPLATWRLRRRVLVL